jgi:hypothetical protein
MGPKFYYGQQSNVDLRKFGRDDLFIQSILVSINSSLFFIWFHYNVSKNIDKVIHYIVVVVVG